MPERNPRNAEGDWYVDTRCIDCGAVRDIAPGLIVARAGMSVFARQPRDAAEELAAWRAMLACPTASVRTESHRKPPPDVFPQALAPGVHRCGYNARASWGAHSYFVTRGSGNLLIDSPRWAGALVRAFARAGGIADVLLTHRDDVADAEKYAARFQARVWIHEHDRDAAPFATRILRGTAPTAIAAGLTAIPLPGHTRGSVAYLLDDAYLFAGDSLAWSVEDGDLEAFRDACWYSWETLADSLRRLAAHRFEWVLPGHGGSARRPAEEMRARLESLIERMRDR